MLTYFRCVEGNIEHHLEFEKALYLGACLLDGAAGLTPDTGLKPAGIACHAVGGALWTENSLGGVTLTAASTTAAQAYADKVFDQFKSSDQRLQLGQSVRSRRSRNTPRGVAELVFLVVEQRLDER